MTARNKDKRDFKIALQVRKSTIFKFQTSFVFRASLFLLVVGTEGSLWDVTW